MTRGDADAAESIRRRLRNHLQARGEDAQFGLQRYAAERFLYRLGESSHRERYILKGAALYALWGGSVYRPTRDVDFTGYGSPNEADVLASFREICQLSGGGDELAFDPSSLRIEPIRDDSEYKGLRIRLEGLLGASRIPVQIDLGFGDAIVPAPQEVTFPTFLDHPAPRIRAYPIEAVVAEKFHAMAMHGARNSRYKDFYDLHTIANQFSFDGEQLARSIAATFAQRQTPITAVQSTALAAAFYTDDARVAQWRAYLGRNHLPGAPADFSVAGGTITTFLTPVSTALLAGEPFPSSWLPGGPWRVRS